MQELIFFRKILPGFNFATIKSVLKIFCQNLWKTPVKELIFFKLQARNLQLYKKWGKLEVLLSVFCGTKIALEWTTCPPPPLCLTHPLILKFFNPPLFSILKTSYPLPICKWGGRGGGFKQCNAIMPSLRNIIPYSLLKPLKPHVIKMDVAFQIH